MTRGLWHDNVEDLTYAAEAYSDLVISPSVTLEERREAIFWISFVRIKSAYLAGAYVDLIRLQEELRNAIQENGKFAGVLDPANILLEEIGEAIKSGSRKSEPIRSERDNKKTKKSDK